MNAAVNTPQRPQRILVNDPLQIITDVSILDFIHNYFKYIVSMTVNFHLCLPGANVQTSWHDQIQEQTNAEENALFCLQAKSIAKS